MDDPGRKLKLFRERLGLRYRDVEHASRQIASWHGSDEFAIPLARLADIENRGTVPSIHRIYTLCAIYRLDPFEVCRWYGVDFSRLPADAARLPTPKTHPIQFDIEEHGEIQVPLLLDPGLDIRKTTFLSRMIQRWGILPVMLVSGLDPKHHRYGFIGLEDWSMYPLIQPGALVLIDDTQKKIETGGWTSEWERPIYFFEHRDGFLCGWCSLEDDRLTVIPHPASDYSPRVFLYPQEIEVIGQVVGVATRLDLGRKRRTRSSADRAGF